MNLLNILKEITISPYRGTLQSSNDLDNYFMLEIPPSKFGWWAKGSDLISDFMVTSYNRVLIRNFLIKRHIPYLFDGLEFSILNYKKYFKIEKDLNEITIKSSHPLNKIKLLKPGTQIYSEFKISNRTYKISGEVRYISGPDINDNHYFIIIHKNDRNFKIPEEYLDIPADETEYKFHQQRAAKGEFMGKQPFGTLFLDNMKIISQPKDELDEIEIKPHGGILKRHYKRRDYEYFRLALEDNDEKYLITWDEYKKSGTLESEILDDDGVKLVKDYLDKKRIPYELHNEEEFLIPNYKKHFGISGEFGKNINEIQFPAPSHLNSILLLIKFLNEKNNRFNGLSRNISNILLSAYFKNNINASEGGLKHLPESELIEIHKKLLDLKQWWEREPDEDFTNDNINQYLAEIEIKGGPGFIVSPKIDPTNFYGDVDKAVFKIDYDKILEWCKKTDRNYNLPVIKEIVRQWKENQLKGRKMSPKDISKYDKWLFIFLSTVLHTQPKNKINEIEIKPKVPMFIKDIGEEDSTGKAYEVVAWKVLDWMIETNRELKDGKIGTEENIWDLVWNWPYGKGKFWNDWTFGSKDNIEQINNNFFQYLIKNTEKDER